MADKDITDELHDERKAALAASALRLRNTAGRALDQLLCDMIAKNEDQGAIEFETEAGRSVVLVLAIGEAAKHWTE